MLRNMNRDAARGANNSLQPAASSNYLVYLFIFSAAFIILLPYLFPLAGMLLRPSKKADTVEKIKTSTFKSSSASSTTHAAFPTDGGMMQKAYHLETKCETLESLIVDLQRLVQIEREKTLVLENEIRILQISERFLKERVQKVEDRNLDFAKASYSSIGLSTQNTAQIDPENIAGLVHELLRMVQKEKERTSALELEVGKLRKSETNLIGRIEMLEQKFTGFMAECKKTDICDRKNEEKEFPARVPEDPACKPAMH